MKEVPIRSHHHHPRLLLLLRKPRSYRLLLLLFIAVQFFVLAFWSHSNKHLILIDESVLLTKHLTTTTATSSSSSVINPRNGSIINASIQQQQLSAAANATATTKTRATYEIVTTILYDRRQSKKRIVDETADWLLSPSVQDIPVTICSPDELVNQDAVLKYGPRTRHFCPEADHVFGHRILSTNRTGAVTILPILNGKLASEVPGYLTYILQNWNSLPDVVIFLHANPLSHDPNILQNIRRVMTQWTPQQIGFLNINDHIMLCRRGRGPGAGSWQKYWEILGFDPKHVPGRIKIPCCAQFMVTKERIYLRPKWFYQQALKLAYESQDAVFFEHYFHLFWGEHPILSEDRELRTYAHSNWTKPVQDAVLHNPFPNEPYSASMKPWYEMAMADPSSYYPPLKRAKGVCPPGNNYWFV